MEVSCKKGVHKNFEIFTWKHLCGASLLAFRPATLLWDSNTDVFLWTWEHLFWRTFENDCFLNSFSKEHKWAAASVSLNLGNLLTDYKQYKILP